MTTLARPSFARDFPRDDALDALVSAFSAGNYALVRAEAPKLAASTTDDDVRRAARVLRERVDADPLAKLLLALALTALVLFVLSAWWLTHDDPPASVPLPEQRLIERIPDKTLR